MTALKLKSKGGIFEDEAKLAEGLIAKEFACPHGYVLIDKEFIMLFDKVRKLFGSPLLITSGYRCEMCQANLIYAKKTTAKNSFHVQGRAIDCRPILTDKVTMLEKIVHLRNSLLIFKDELRIGVYPTHIHFDDGFRDNKNLCPEWWVMNGRYVYLTDIWK